MKITTATNALHQPCLTWYCDACGEPIADGEGYLEVSVTEANAVRQAWKDARKAKQRESGCVVWSGGELAAMPDQAPWMAWHSRCDPNPDGSGYWFWVERCRTAAQLLDWTAHLAGKSWFKHTSWTSLLYGVPGVGGATHVRSGGVT
ncbi:MAG: hypothetical protein AB1679_12230 [Actinomycetota bacterium]